MDGLKGRIDYPLLKKNLTVELTQEDERRLEEIIREICLLIEQEYPPHFQAINHTVTGS